MRHIKPSDFPELRRVFSGYLHEDFQQEYGSAAAAVRAYEADADDEERRRFRAEARRFLELTEPLEFAKVLALLSRLGCRWKPPSRDALAEVVTGQPGSDPTVR